MRQTLNKKELHDRLQYERRLWSEGLLRVMGLDEVGRGCLAGPVVAAGVILMPGDTHEGLRDSKVMSEVERDTMADWVRHHALYWHVAERPPSDIDRLNILGASLRAMLDCVESEGAKADHLLVDGNRFMPCLIPHTCIVKGDDRSASIAAASILAKTHRDKLMRELHEAYPQYSWDRNVGYPTRAHFEALERHGYTIHHRRSFALRTDRQYQPA